MLNSSSSELSLRSRSLLARLDDFEHGADVVLHVQAAKDRGFLRQVADAEARAPVHRQMRDVVAVEADDAAIGRNQPGDHVEDRGLAGAVRPEQADRLAGAQAQGRVVHHGAAAIALLQALDGEHAGGAERRLTLEAVEGLRPRGADRFGNRGWRRGLWGNG